MTSAQVVETSVNVISNSPSQDYTHPDDRTLLYDMTPGFKPFTIPGWFAIALWAHIGPIPLLVLFRANSQGIVFMQKFSVEPNLDCRPN